MRRTLLVVFVLAVLSMSAAFGLQASSAKPHKSIASATTSHKPKTIPHKKAMRSAGRVPGRTARHASAHKYAAGVEQHPALRRQPSRVRQVVNSRPGAQFHSKAKFRRVASSYPSRKLATATKPYEATKTIVATRPNEAEMDSLDETNAGRAAVAGAAGTEATEVASATATEPTHPAAADAVSLRKTLRGMPPPLRGSLESLVRQNEKTEADNLERIEDDSDLNDRILRGMLVPVPVSTALTINGKLPENRRYCRPWTANFLTDLGRAHGSAFHRPLEVSSAVRTVAYQKQLERINGNATAAEGDIASPHLTGAAIDIAKQGMTRQEIGWMRAWLLPLENAGMIDVEEEFRQSCFHITVYKSYSPPVPPHKKAVQATGAQSITDRAGV